MGIVIAVIITAIVVAGACAAVYVFIFRSKQNQATPNQQGGMNVPVYGMDQSLQQPMAGQPVYGDMPSAQPTPAPSQMMNDITGAPQGMDMPAAPEPPVQEDSYIVPAVNPVETPAPVQPEMTSAPQPVESPTIENPLDLNQMGNTGNLLDDTPAAPISEMAAQNNNVSAAPGDMADSSVPATQEETPAPPLVNTTDALASVEAKVGEQSASEPTDFQPPMAPQAAPTTEPSQGGFPPQIPASPEPEEQSGPKDMNI